jgi:hypothetical protein
VDTHLATWDRNGLTVDATPSLKCDQSADEELENDTGQIRFRPLFVANIPLNDWPTDKRHCIVATAKQIDPSQS